MEAGHIGPTVPSSAISALRSQAQEAGLSVDDIATDIGVGRLAPNGAARMSLTGFLRLQTRLTTLLQDETCRLSKRQLLSGSTELALSRLPSRGSLVDAMGTVAQSYNLLHGGAFNSVEETDDHVAFVIDDRDFPYAISDEEQVLFTMETTLLFVHALLRLIVPSAAAGGWRGADLKREASPARVPFESHVPVQFGTARYRLLYDKTSASRIVNLPPPGTITLARVTDEQVRLVEGGVDDRTFSGRVRLLIEEGATDQSMVAESLGMSVATLRRRLVDEGASFRTLRMEALKSQADKFLQTDMPLVQVAERLGFSDVRSFSRAFKTWTGMTPNARRKNAQN